MPRIFSLKLSNDFCRGGDFVKPLFLSRKNKCFFILGGTHLSNPLSLNPPLHPPSTFHFQNAVDLCYQNKHQPIRKHVARTSRLVFVLITKINCILEMKSRRW